MLEIITITALITATALVVCVLFLVSFVGFLIWLDTK